MRDFMGKNRVNKVCIWVPNCHPGNKFENVGFWIVITSLRFILTKFPKFETWQVRFRLSATTRFLKQCLMQKGDKLSFLELSVGPYIYNMLSAAAEKQIDRNDCTDFCTSNLEYLNNVIKDHRSSKFDWPEYIKMAYAIRPTEQRSKFGTAQKFDFRDLGAGTP